MKHKDALLRDLQKLQGELPLLIAGVEAGDEAVYADAVALVRGAGRERVDRLMKQLVNHIFDEAVKGNKEPLLELARSTAGPPR